MRKVGLSLGIVLLLTFLVLQRVFLTRPVFAQSSTPAHPVALYLFWGEGCPHCAKARPYLESLTDKYPGVALNSYEIYYNQDNQVLFSYMAQKYGLEQLVVPTIFIGPYYLQGYSEELNPDIEAVVSQCLQSGCTDAGVGVINIPQVVTPASLVSTQAPVTAIPAPQSTSTAIPSESPNNPGTPRQINQGHYLELPLIGRIDLEYQSTTLSTALIAFVDGLNPCSIWVLTMLLAITLHSGSRKKVLIIGLIFLTVTAGIYALFIAGLFTVLTVTNFWGWIQIVVALAALFFALVNIKDYFWYKEGLSFTIAEEKKPEIYQRMRSLIDASQSFWSLAGATIVLAAGVSLVEFSCTAGFPALWTNLLVSQHVSAVLFVFLLLLYLLIYQLDELVIFSSAVFTFKASRLEEKHGRILKLSGGMLMLTLAVVMLINPALMNNLSSSLLIFGIALLATLLVLLFHRFILPKAAGRIGSMPGRGNPAKIASRRHSHKVSR